ncbi:MAG: glycosyltransferase, partial [Prolixibacteraceae bacterium]|nr:glycosyltransferase [Prolixibacteraceae bacterium]
MVIAVNTRLLLKGKLEGIGWFTFETLKRMTVRHPEHRYIFIFDRPYSEDFIFSDNIIPVVVFPPTRHPVLWYIWFEFQIPRVLKRYGADIFLSPDGYLSLRTKVPQLAVIHDINLVHRPADLPWLKAEYYNFFFPRFAEKAKRIATVSSYSKEDIVD